MSLIDVMFYIAVLIMSVVIHEFFHAYAAYLLGDDTAYEQGRLTLNPLKHLDLFGSIILPGLLALMQTRFMMGWAKPVPVNPDKLRHKRSGTLIVVIAGIMANLGLAVVFGLLLRYGDALGIQTHANSAGNVAPFYRIASVIVITNLTLAFFNLIPIPPLDGSKILFSFLPFTPKWRAFEAFLEQWGMMILLLFILTVWSKVSPLIYSAFSLITGFY